MNLMTPYALADSDHGCSAEAESLRALLGGVEVSGGSAAFYAPVWELDEFYSEASEDDWDGQEGKAVSHDAYLYAREFLIAFATGLTPTPEFSASPGGDVLLEWSTGPRHVFTLAFGSKGEKYYAGLFGANKMNGREDLLERVVDVAHQVLDRVYSSARPLRRRHAA
jgi:hypothetical protein